VTVLIVVGALLVGAVVTLFVLIAVGEAMSRSAAAPPSAAEVQRVTSDLAAIRRRLDVAELTDQAKADARRLRRELDDELDDSERNQS
jgi:hypothetical protein